MATYGYCVACNTRVKRFFDVSNLDDMEKKLTSLTATTIQSTTSRTMSDPVTEVKPKATANVDTPAVESQSASVSRSTLGRPSCRVGAGTTNVVIQHGPKEGSRMWYVGNRR